MAKHLDTTQAVSTGFRVPMTPQHRLTEEFIPDRDVWTTPEDIKAQRHEFDANRAQREV